VTNGAGKTNLLEAVHYAALLRSFRNPQPAKNCASGTVPVFTGGDPGWCRHRAATAGDAGQQERSLQVGWHSGEPGPVIFINHFLVVAFISRGYRAGQGPRQRAPPISGYLGSQLDAGYLRTLSDYNQVLRQRNALLRQYARFGDRALDAC